MGAKAVVETIAGKDIVLEERTKEVFSVVQSVIFIVVICLITAMCYLSIAKSLDLINRICVSLIFGGIVGFMVGAAAILILAGLNILPCVKEAY